MNSDHCIIDILNSRLLCTRCEGTMPLTLPVSVQEFSALSRDFIQQHAACPASSPPSSGDSPAGD